MRSNKSGKYAHSLLAVYCGKKESLESNNNVLDARAFGISSSTCEKSLAGFLNCGNSGDAIGSAKRSSDFYTAGQLEVHALEAPNKAEFKLKLETLEPDIVYFVGECIEGTDEVGPLELADGLVSVEAITTLFSEKMPELVCLETCSAGKVGDALRNKGIPYIVYWKGPITHLWVMQFRQALLAVLRSSSGQIWSACQLAKTAFLFQRGIAKAYGSSDNTTRGSSMSPVIVGNAPPKMPEAPRIKDSAELEGSSNMLPKVQIYDEDVDVPLLIVGETQVQDNKVFNFLEDGLNALLMVEITGMRLVHRVSASSQPSNAAPLTRGVITMRCDLCTTTSARISLLVAGSPQTCFDDQMLEYSIKKELLEQNKIMTSLMGPIENPVADVRRSAAVACGEHVIEVRFRSPSWAVQVLRQLAREVTFRSLVSLGIAGIQGFPVAAFLKEDADRFFALRSSSSRMHSKRETENHQSVTVVDPLPSWFSSPASTRKRQWIGSLGAVQSNPCSGECQDKESSSAEQLKLNRTVGCNFLAAMKPVPRAHCNRDMSYLGTILAGVHNTWNMRVNLVNGINLRPARVHSSSTTHVQASTPLPTPHKVQNVRSPSPVQITSLNPMPMKKHGCNRRPIHECSEEEFRKDVMQFLISRGHARLVPSSDVNTFPDAVLNGKRLDLYNLYREVVSRGGFHVGNGINWKGQVFSKMHNHTVMNKMTGVGNTLKRHYETYLLEYELAHDDVDGECCILCHSSAAGDWVNCGACGEWAHYGCDKRHGLGAFKEYAKTDGLEYVCPRCSASNGKNSGRKRAKASTNGFSRSFGSIHT
ncbi:hypothetical protein KP509_01G059600 [Ceratopteris richardii]|uniref:ARID domain-containing protein n=1 Tax=Ceratopteris richardii TaxID=49495 RepID=A0A8T2VLR0_CERRI|nr:hypothetical protein KP509_01G059600 [Ceratopteris richardii]KAH7446504.1 hypothetical protein KP509_01G059600 [Ceratopteris richardii]KAH7446505.1 hypothetical protein KP509_01G059600 [Ceratopteris richardii]